MIRINRKKAQIGDTMMWILATLLIFFLMFFFIMFVSLASLQEKVGLIKNVAPSNADIVTTKNLISFLQKDVSGEKMYDLIAKADVGDGNADRIKMFQSESQKFLENSYPISDYSKSWLRIYKSDEEVQQYAYGSLSDYYIYRTSPGYEGKGYCDPKANGGAFASILILPDKKIAVCANGNN